jgi:NSS family neurotransmitter:Na+ symporter
VKRAYWNTRFGFYLAAIGSAIGLGNLWRFPYVVANDGGGAFVLLYILMTFLIASPLLIGELILGKSTRKSILAATFNLEGSVKKYKFHWIGRLCLLLSLFIASYYAVISGWVLHFVVNFSRALFHAEHLSVSDPMQMLLDSGWLQLALASVHLLFCAVVTYKGVQDGLEKWISNMMPIFGILLVVLVFRSLSLPKASEALKFVFYPDFTKLSLSSLGHAIGHACFTLSVGFGVMVTFGSYLQENDHIPTAGFRVTVTDCVLSLFAGLLVFPIVLSGAAGNVKDPTLLFATLPQFFLGLPNGILFGWAFFICLYLAALGATIGLMEVIVSNVQDQLRTPRSWSNWIVLTLCLALAVGPSFSSSFLESVRVRGNSIMENLDSFLINWMLPVIALGLSFLFSRGLNVAQSEKHFVDVNRIESVALFGHWKVLIRYVIPVVIVIALVMQLIALMVS